MWASVGVVVEDVGALTGVQQLRTMPDRYLMLRWYGMPVRRRKTVYLTVLLL